jgi:alpha-tubulin suppressor-like RCC1 family protein
MLGLGDGSKTTVYGISNAVAVSVADSKACAVLADGSMQCWGEGAVNWGTSYFYPMQMTSVTTNAVAVSVGSSSACAVVKDGSIQCWGDNSYGELGTGSYQVGGTSYGTAVALVTDTLTSRYIAPVDVGAYFVAKVTATNSQAAVSIWSTSNQ